MTVEAVEGHWVGRHDVTADVSEDLGAALVAALAEITTVGKDKRADAGSYSYAYADLDALVRLTRPALAAQGLVALTPVHAFEDRLACTVTLVHRSGEVLAFPPLPFPEGPDARGTGSWISYFRRYALLAALGLAAAEGAGRDDDGEHAAADPTPQARKRLGRKVHDLDEDRRTELRAWLEAEGLPDRAAAMDLEQIGRVEAWIRG